MIKWKGGESPVGHDVMVRVRTRDSVVPRDVSPAQAYCWEHDGSGSDIVAYEVQDAEGFSNTRLGKNCLRDARVEAAIEATVGKEGAARALCQPAGGMVMSGTNSTDGTLRAFGTGATRSSEVGRYDPEGFLSPIAIERYCVYMNKHRRQADGTLRDSDNWQRGLPLSVYVKGMWRHFLHLWARHRGWPVQDTAAGANTEEDLCALLFNVQGMLHEVVKRRLPKEGENDREMKYNSLVGVG